MHEIYFLDLVGTFAFASYGSYIALRKKFDLLGIFICAFLTAVGGGTIREIILGHSMFYFSDPNYIIDIMLGTLTSILLFKNFQRIRNIIMILDAIGLVSFAFIGASAAFHLNLGFFAIVFLAFISAVGGGILRDVLLGEVSEIMYRGFYASVAILLGILYGLLGDKVSNFYYANSLLIFCLLIRLITGYFKINLWSPFRKTECILKKRQAASPETTI